MDFMTALDIGASGMSADRTQLNVTAMNLANAKTTRMPGGNGPYVRKTVIKTTSDLDNRFGVHMRTELDREVKGVRVMGVALDNRPTRRVYEPGHPDANEEGFVEYPVLPDVLFWQSCLLLRRRHAPNDLRR